MSLVPDAEGMSMAKTIIAYDLGTGGAKASLYDADGICLAGAFVPYETIYPNSGWHEQRPSDWWRAVVASTRILLEQKPGSASNVDCLGISGQSLAVIPLDSRGSLLRESIPIWSDTRASRQTADFFSRVDRDRWYMTTGNGFPAECYSVFKIMWYRDNEPGLFSRITTVMGSKDYVNFRLTGKMLTDYSYASGTGIYDLAGWRYSQEFLTASGLPPSFFPEIVPSTRIIGTLTAEAAGDLGLPRSVKVACGGVDNSCMALGARNTGEGRVYTSLGSSCWIAVSSAKPVLEVKTRPYVFAHVIPGLFTSAVSIFSGGNSFRWIRDTVMGSGTTPDGRDAYEVMNELAAASPIGARQLMFNPSLAGGSSLEPSPHIRGAFAGIDLRHSRGDVIRAGMEGIAMNLGAALEVLRRFGPLAPQMLLVGGGSKSPLWRQIFADVYRMECVKTNVDQEAGSLGAAAVAAVGAGLWKSLDAVDGIHTVQDVRMPIPANVEKYRRLMPAFEMLRRHQAELGDLLHGMDA
jgi:xylulokinase